MFGRGSGTPFENPFSNNPPTDLKPKLHEKHHIKVEAPVGLAF